MSSLFFDDEEFEIEFEPPPLLELACLNVPVEDEVYIVEEIDGITIETEIRWSPEVPCLN